MKNLTLPALLLTFIASSNTSYGSLIESDGASSTSTKLIPSFSANSLEPSKKNNKVEIDLLKVGFYNLKTGHEDKAMAFFEKAISTYGSPLGYLYAGALTHEDHTSQRYLNIAQLAVKGKAIPNDVFDQHVEVLVQMGLLAKH